MSQSKQALATFLLFKTPKHYSVLGRTRTLISKSDKADIGRQDDDVTLAPRKFFSLSSEVRVKALSEIADALELDDVAKLPAFFATNRIRVAKIGIFEDPIERARVTPKDQKR